MGEIIKFKETEDYLPTLTGIISDNNFTLEEKRLLVSLQESHKESKDNVKDQSRELRGNIIDTKREVISAIKSHPAYVQAKNDIKGVSRADIKSLQSLVGAGVDGIFGPNTFSNYVNSPYFDSGLSVEELAKSVKITDKNINSYKEKIGKLTGVDSEAFGSLDLSIGDIFYYEGKSGNLIIYSAIKNEKIVVNVDEMILGELKTFFEAGDKEELLDFYKKLSPNKAIGYTKILIRYINTNSLFQEARSLFTSQSSRAKYKIDFQNRFLNKYMTAAQLFGDEDYLKKGAVIYKRQENGDYRSASDKRLAVSSGNIIKVVSEEAYKEYEKTAKYRKRSSKKEQVMTEIETNEQLRTAFGIFVDNPKLIKLKKDCGKAVMSILLDGFLKENFDGVTTGYSGNRNGTNIDSMLTGDVSEENKFIVRLSSSKTIGYTSIKDVTNNTGVDIKKIVDNLPIKFDLIQVDTPWDALPGDICVYDEKAKQSSGDRSRYGHAEIVSSSGKFISYYRGNNPGGSVSMSEKAAKKNIKAYKQNTGFKGVLRMSLKS